VDLQTSQFERIGCFGRWRQPYKTMARDYEARTLEAFYGFLEKGFVYRGLKPVYWCIHDRTALAEAEVEYAQHTSPSVYVRYRLTSDPAAIDPALAGKQVSTIIWTTTPWTLPASMAVAFHPDFEYVALQVNPRLPEPQSLGAPSIPRSSAEWVGDQEPGPVYIVAAELAQASVIAAANSARPRNWPASKAAGWIASPSSIPSWTAAFWASTPPTSPPTPAPARSTRLRPTARTTFIPASATASISPAASTPWAA
jgi:isoleucyl-tRNA synthetase